MKRIGYMIAVVVVIIAVFFVFPLFRSPCTPARMMEDKNKLRQIGLACQLYAVEHDGRYPPDFSVLTKYTGKYTKLYASTYDFDRVGAMSNVMEWTSFVYFPGITTSSPPDTVVAFLAPRQYPKFIRGLILFADAHVETVDPAQFTRIMNEAQRDRPRISTIDK